MEPLQFLKLDHRVTSIAQQLAIEEALLRTDSGNWCLVKHGAAPTIIMGISGKPEHLLNEEQVEKADIPILKRFSGGGTVVVDENTLFVSFIGNHTLLPCSPFPRPIMRWTTSIYQPVLGDLGFALRDNDYVLGKKKIGGNAQSLTKKRFVHHTTFLWDYQQQRMDLLKIPERQPEYRKGRDHESFLTTLRPHFHTPQHFFDGVLTQLSLLYSVTFPAAVELEEIVGRPHRRTTRWIKKTYQQGAEAFAVQPDS